MLTWPINRTKMTKSLEAIQCARNHVEDTAKQKRVIMIWKVMKTYAIGKSECERVFFENNNIFHYSSKHNEKILFKYMVQKIEFLTLR